MNIKDTGKRIKTRRNELGVDQRSLSELSGIAVHTLSNIEAGSGNPTLSTLAAVLKPLGMELAVQIQE